VIVLNITFGAGNGEIMVLMAFNRWVCRPRVLASVAVLSCVLCGAYGWRAAEVEGEVCKEGGGDLRELEGGVE
jgi:hypothetical protein